MIINEKDKGGPTTVRLDVSENGIYQEADKVYSPVVVDVPQTTIEQLTVTENATYTAPEGKAYSPVVVNVPLPPNAHLLKSATTYPITPSLLPLPKAEVTFEGTKAELYVGSEPIVVAEDNTPYTYRQSPSNKSAVDVSLVGGTIARNQLVENGDFSNGTTNWGVTGLYNLYISVADNEMTCRLGVVANNGYDNSARAYTGVTTNHVYYSRYDIYVSKTSLVNVKYNNGQVTKEVGAGWNTLEIIFKANDDTEGGYYGISNAEDYGYQTDDTYKLRKVNLIDLTQAFGSTIADYVYSLEQSTAGSGIAWLKSYGFLSKDYYAYNAGGLESVNVASRKVVGFNQWDEVTEKGYINDNNGANYSGNDWLRSKNYVHILPNTIYYFANNGNRANADVYFYDAEKTYLGRYTGGHIILENSNQTFTTPSNAYYMRFYMASSYGTTYNNDICINISDASKNGTYEPYTSTTYDLGSDKLNGLFYVENGELKCDGDIKTSDGIIHRNFLERAYQSGDESLANAITDGTNTVVKKSTPTTETSTPFTNPQLVGGTEEFTDATSRDVMIPCGQDSNYANSDIYISYGTSPIDMAKEHAIIPYTSTYIDSNGSEDVEYWD